MWSMVVVTLAGAWASDPTSADSAPAIDCSTLVGDDKTTCEADIVRLAELDGAIAALNCTKGRKKKQEACNATMAELELEKAEIEAKHAAPPEPAKTREINFMGEEEEDGQSRGGKPQQTLEQDIADE